MTTRTDTARRNVASGVPAPLFYDDFEVGFDPSWAFSNAVALGGDSTKCHSGEYCGFIEPNNDNWSGTLTLASKLAPNTDYTLTFYEYFLSRYPRSCYLSVNSGDASIWDYEDFTESSDAPTQRTVTFSTSDSSDLDLYFQFGCTDNHRAGIWFVDDVALYAGTIGNARRRK